MRYSLDSYPGASQALAEALPAAHVQLCPRDVLEQKGSSPPAQVSPMQADGQLGLTAFQKVCKFRHFLQMKEARKRYLSDLI